MHGKGTMVWPNGEMYDGYWILEKWYKEWQGKRVFESNRPFIGEFLNNKAVRGKSILSNGSVYY